MAWVDTCLKPGPGSRKAGLVVGECAVFPLIALPRMIKPRIFLAFIAGLNTEVSISRIDEEERDRDHRMKDYVRQY